MSKQYKNIDLLIVVVSLISVIFHFLSPNIAFAAVENKKNMINFQFLHSTKPNSIILAGNNIQKSVSTSTLKQKNKINYQVSAAIIKNYQPIENIPIEKIKNNESEEEFFEYIAKDKFINIEKEAQLVAGNLKIISRKRVLITAYSSTPDQTDSTPFITAANTHVHDGIIAANFLPFGTKVRIPLLFQNKIFTVEDRMKSDTKMDIWFSSRQEAKNFGVKITEIEIVENL